MKFSHKDQLIDLVIFGYVALGAMFAHAEGLPLSTWAGYILFWPMYLAKWVASLVPMQQESQILFGLQLGVVATVLVWGFVVTWFRSEEDADRLPRSSRRTPAK